jgi:hypothetical protein
MSLNTIRSAAMALSEALMPKEMYEKVVEDMIEMHLRSRPVMIGIRLQAEFKRLFSYEDLKNWQADQFSIFFTDEELEMIYRMYDTPLGKKMLKVMPQVAQSAINFIQLKLNPETERILNPRHQD